MPCISCKPSTCPSWLASSISGCTKGDGNGDSASSGATRPPRYLLLLPTADSRRHRSSDSVTTVSLCFPSGAFQVVSGGLLYPGG
ncbi:hypothetical protein BJ165DRAFT_1521092 [Panaeolus papilionaceus]|nr:hypothetical protein BJ165DRAFT_1521092 [Panaeolus papilionaceus]